EKESGVNFAMNESKVQNTDSDEIKVNDLDQRKKRPERGITKKKA
ncbi:hypothetical protein M153_11180003, partial [Pseudoloma neurophilia]